MKAIFSSGSVAGASIILLLLLWHLGATIADTDTWPPPLSVFLVIYEAGLSGELFLHTGITLWRVLASFVISMLAQA